MTKKFIAMSAAAGVFGTSAMAFAAEPTTAELMAQIESLQSKVQKLEATTTGPTASAVDATVASVLNDANKRSQMLALEGAVAGFDGKEFYLASSDGKFKLVPQFQIQVRNTTNYISDNFKNGDSSLQNGFEIRRAKFGLKGNAISDKLEFFLLWASGASGGSLSLEQAWAKYWFADNVGFRIGQYVTPVFSEQFTSSRMQLAADRSLANTLITGTNEAFTQGVELVYKEGQLSASVGFTDGFSSGNTTFEDPAVNNANFGVTGRVDYTVSGDAKNVKDYTATGTKDDTLVIGGGIDWTQAEGGNTYLHTVDVRYENTGGLSVAAMYLGNYFDPNEGGDSVYNWAIVGQVGYLIQKDVEIFGRAGYTKFDNDVTFASGDSEDNFLEFTAGVNYYLLGHNAKVTIDATYLPNGSPVDAKGLGILATNENEIIIRGQFQLAL